MVRFWWNMIHFIFCCEFEFGTHTQNNHAISGGFLRRHWSSGELRQGRPPSPQGITGKWRNKNKCREKAEKLPPTQNIQLLTPPHHPTHKFRPWACMMGTISDFYFMPIVRYISVEFSLKCRSFHQHSAGTILNYNSYIYVGFRNSFNLFVRSDDKSAYQIRRLRIFPKGH